MILQSIQDELRRLQADEATATLDSRFEPQAGELVKFTLPDTYWHLLPNQFLTLLQSLPSGAGNEAIRTAIEQQAPTVWHGPAPEGSRDTSP